MYCNKLAKKLEMFHFLQPLSKIVNFNNYPVIGSGTFSDARYIFILHFKKLAVIASLDKWQRVNDSK